MGLEQRLPTEVYADASILGHGTSNKPKSGVGIVIKVDGDISFEASNRITVDYPIHILEARAALMAMTRLLIDFPAACRVKVRLFSDSSWFVDRFNKITTIHGDTDLWTLLFSTAAMFADLEVCHIKRSKLGSEKRHERADWLAKKAAANGAVFTPKVSKSKPTGLIFSVRVELLNGLHREESFIAGNMTEAVKAVITRSHLGIMAASRIVISNDSESRSEG